MLHHDFALKIEAGRKPQIFVRGPRIAIDAPMLTATIRIQTGFKIQVRAMVAGDDALAMINQELRARQDILRGVPIRIRLKLYALKTVRRIFRRAPMGGIFAS